MLTTKNPQKYMPSARTIKQLCSMVEKKDPEVFKKILSVLEEDVIALYKDTCPVELKK